MAYDERHDARWAERHTDAFAGSAVQRLQISQRLRRQLSLRGRTEVERHFDAEENTENLLALAESAIDTQSSWWGACRHDCDGRAGHLSRILSGPLTCVGTSIETGELVVPFDYGLENLGGR